MKTEEKKTKSTKVRIEAERSKYAGKPLNSSKEEAAKKFEGTAMSILKQFGLTK